jgi:Flp pilus assembly protein TadD
MTKNGITPIRSVKNHKLTLILAIGLITGSVTAAAAGQSDSYCQSAGEQNGYDCAKAQSFQAKQSDIDAKLKELNRWMTDEQQAQGKTLVTPDQPESDKLREKIRFNAQLLAGELKQAKKLQSKGDLEGAFDRVNDYLVTNPKDPNGWLLYGISLINQNKLNEAADIFSKLIRLYPDSPEPYNNLAVVYARKGDNEKAVDVLLQAFETHPSYAQVQSNLKAVYAALATQAYNRALDLDTSHKAPRANLGVLDQVYQPASATLLASAPAQQSVAAASEATAKPAASVSQPAAQVVASAQPKTGLVIEERDKSEGIVPAQQAAEPATAGDKNGQTGQQTATGLASTVDTAEQGTVADNTSIPAKLSTPLKAEIQQMISNWAASWAAQDVQAYLDFYTAEYTPEAGISHKQWVWGRKQRLTAPSFIKVDISDISVAEAGNGTIRSVFRQKYQSDTYQDEVYKTLTLTQENGHWKITTESTL